MNQFTLKTIQKGRLDNSTMNEIVGGQGCSIFECPVHSVTECGSVRATFTSCSPSSATYQECTPGDSYTTCDPTYQLCQGKG
jgi:hypothetical protein